MSKHDPQMKQTGDGARPTAKCPEMPNVPDASHGECTGTIHGELKMQCCCPRLYTRTYVLNIGPQTEAQLQTFLQNTVTAWEGAGYVILAHSVADIGAGWMFGITVGWYA